ncbi:MAG: CRISPR-associated CARF protein Csa3 [Candidatus Thermoplasmatota archaeon]|nr:CRISPR-associated CARF protein Csa3 [Candidatus Thermoplasmatota archaeon]
MNVIISVLGFDEKFHVRSLMRHGTKEISKYIVIIPDPSSQERTRKTLESLRSIAQQVDISIEEFSVNYLDFFDAIEQILDILKKNKEFGYILNLSGRLRVLDFEVLSAFIILRKNAKVEIEPETFIGGPVEFEVNDLIYSSMDNMSVSILSHLRANGGSTVGLTESTGASRTTVWRKLKKLESNGFVSSRHGSVYTITQKAELFLSVNEMS